MSLRKKQSKFAHMIALLILHAEQLGYEITFGDCYRDERCSYGHPNSNHRRRLAVDINLFKDGQYLTSDQDFVALREYWVAIGGADQIDGDANHFSLDHNGII